MYCFVVAGQSIQFPHNTCPLGQATRGKMVHYWNLLEEMARLREDQYIDLHMSLKGENVFLSCVLILESKYK